MLSWLFTKDTVKAELVPTQEVVALVPPPLSIQKELERLASILKEEDTLEAPVERKIAPTSDVKCFCVRFIREKLGVPVRGDADKLERNTSKIEKGIVIIFKLKNSFHAGLITKYADNKIYYRDSNRNNDCKEGSGVIDMNDSKQTSRIYGFHDPYLTIELAKKQLLISNK